MTDKTQSQQAVYGSKQVATQLEIQESTLRKYCLILQDQGYEFFKNEHGHRGFFDRDLIVLRKFLELKSKGDMSLDNAAKSVISWVNSGDVTGVVTDDVTDNTRYDARYNELLEEFKSFKEQQMTYNQRLLDELQKQQEYIVNSLDQRDKALMASIREIQETKKELAATTPTEDKKRPWWQFWR